MFSIGEFAVMGRVSVRMLRHYDAIGLLTPARTDPSTGYRFYSADQLSRLNRVIALKDLGFTLQQVHTILAEKVDVAELRGMLRLRRAQLQDHLATETARLARIDARLRLIESEGHMNTEDVVLKAVPPIRVAELSAVAASYDAEHIGPTLTPLYPELFRRIEAAGVPMSGAPMAYYDPAAGTDGAGSEGAGSQGADADAVRVHAAVPVSSIPDGDHDFDVVELPGIDEAATLIHHGPMENVDTTMQILARWIEDNGYLTLNGKFAREIYVAYDPADAEHGVTEMQVPVRRG